MYPQGCDHCMNVPSVHAHTLLTWSGWCTWHRWKEQDAYIDHLLSVLDSSGAAEMAKLKESESKLQQRVEEFTRRENVLNMRLATKQQELQELVVSAGTFINDIMHSINLCLFYSKAHAQYGYSALHHASKIFWPF